MGMEGNNSQTAERGPSPDPLGLSLSSNSTKKFISTAPRLPDLPDQIQIRGRKGFSQFSSVAQLCLILCDPMDCSTPGLPVHHPLPKFTQTHVYWVSDAIQPSHPLLSPSPPAFNLSQHQVFSNESVLRIRWPEYWSFSFNISPCRTDLL